MAFDREFLGGFGLNEDQIEACMEAHEETVNYFNGEIEKAKAKREELTSLEAELERAKENVKSENEWRAKYEAVKAELEAAKAEGAKRDAFAAKKKAYRELLVAAGVRDKAVNLIAESNPKSINDMVLVDGKVLNREATMANIRFEWSDFIY